ncbi:MAG: flagellar biosynthesis protein FlhB [SAR324 cluster bacterium]|nr:flagellar biosynthesis protein FlhB [SAR324 cluster bacterium]
MAEGSEEKTEAPSQKKRDDARQDGQVAFSKEVSGAALLGSFLLLIWFGGEGFQQSWLEIIAFSFKNLARPEMDANLAANLFMAFIKPAGLIVFPFFLTAIVVGVFSSVLQVGFNITGKPLVPKLDKLSPIAGIGRMFSKQSFSELIKSIFKLTVIGYIGYYTFLENTDALQNLIAQDSRVLLGESFHMIGMFTFRLFIALLLMAIFDYMFQRYDLEQKLKMSKQDLKEEMKQSEGDPMIKARIRQIQQEMSQSRMMQEVPTADVVVSNPTHFAIAMKYDREVMAAPEVIAKGSDFLALRIIEVARENGVIVYENAPVARGLYFQSEIGDQVPEEFFRAIAEILAFVYKAKKRK